MEKFIIKRENKLILIVITVWFKCLKWLELKGTRVILSFQHFKIYLKFGLKFFAPILILFILIYVLILKYEILIWRI